MAHAKTATNGRGSNGSGSHATIGTGTRVRGKITGEGSLLVEGEVDGEIRIDGQLSIAPGGSVTSGVEASEVHVEGSLEGDVKASGDVVIAAGARVRGDVQGAHVAIEEGAQFAGRLDCDFELPSELTGGAGGSTGKRR
jgi:cytoskeletal protein CcmA (bactofilin family)